MSTHNIFIATYTRPQLAEISLAKLHEAGLDMHKLRIISQDNFDVPKQHEGASVLHSFDELEPEFFACIPADDREAYVAELDAGRLLIVAEGSRQDMAQAESSAEDTHPTNWDGLADSTVYYGCAQ